MDNAKMKHAIILNYFTTLFFLSIFIWPNSSAAGFSLFSNDLTPYDCKSEDAARSCTKCELQDKDLKFKIDVNVDKSTVIITYLYKGKNIGGPGALDQCKVVDRKNWQCGKGSSFDEFNNYTNNLYGMTNGSFYLISQSKSQGIPRYNIPPRNFNTFFCAN
jgi:hypothetical protein